jgi:hypothetical protein
LLRYERPTADGCEKHTATVSAARRLRADGPGLTDEDRASQRALAGRLLDRAPGDGTLIYELDDVTKRPALLGPHGSMARRLVAALCQGKRRSVQPIGALEALRDWRNRFFGHGALGEDARALREAWAQLPRALRVCGALGPLFPELRLGDKARDDDPPAADPHQGARWGDVGLRPLLDRLGVRHAGEERPPGPQALEWVERRR